MVIQVISPGYGRTGTTSLKNALEILGYGPCYHMDQVTQRMGTHPQLWIDGYKGRGLPVRKIFDDYSSVTDWPATDFYQEIMQEYPDAKVVLTLRDPDSWWGSIKNTVHSQSSPLRAWGVFFFKAFSPRFRRFSYMLRHVAPLGMEEAEAKADFLRHCAEVKAVVPVDKLLEFSVKEGWEPLCTFLGVPVPDVPFPRSNSREELSYMISRRMCMAGWVAMLLAIGAAGATAGMAFFFGGRHFGGAVAAVNVCILSSCMMEAVRASRFYGKKATKEGSTK